jgi:hypothetical protein
LVLKFVAGICRLSRFFRAAVSSTPESVAGLLEFVAPIGISAALEISRLVAIPLVAPRIPGVQVLR